MLTAEDLLSAVAITETLLSPVPGATIVPAVTAEGELVEPNRVTELLLEVIATQMDMSPEDENFAFNVLFRYTISCKKINFVS